MEPAAGFACGCGCGLGCGFGCVWVVWVVWVKVRLKSAKMRLTTRVALEMGALIGQRKVSYSFTEK